MEIQAIYILGMTAAAASCIIGILYVCAASIRDETALHDVKVEARRMRIEFDRRVYARNAGMHADQGDDDEEVFLVV
jgi:hypothetical protein